MWSLDDRPATVAAPLNEEPTVTGKRRRKPGRILISVAGPVAFLGVMAYVVATHGSEISRAGTRAPATTLLASVGLALVALLARSEAAVSCLTAMGNRPGRFNIHAASSAAYVVGTVNHYVASPARAAVLRRLDRERAPTIPQMFMVDASTYLVEGLLAATLLVVSASALKLRWWIPALAVIGALAALVVALTIRQRLQRHLAFRGLEMLAHSRQRVVVLILAVLIFACQIARTLLVLRATGLHPSLLQATATFIAAGVLSNFLAGPAAGTAGAPLIIFGRQSLGAAAASGLILSVTALLAALVYALACGPVVAWRIRHSAYRSAGVGA